MKLKGMGFIVSLLLLGLTVGCGEKNANGEKGGIVAKNADAASNSVENLRPTDVKVMKIIPMDVKDIYTVPGVAEAWEVVSVPTETSGPVNWIGKEEGDMVNIGDPILKVNTESLEATLNSTKVQLEGKRKDFIRTDNLFKQDSVSLKSYDDAKDALAIADVNYRLALDEYNKSIVKSPIKGSVDNIAPKKGEYVSPGTVVATVVTMDKLKIYIDVPEKDVPFLRLGQEVDVYPADISDTPKKIKGKINYISQTSNPKTLTYKARVDLENQELIKPGRIVRADIVRRDLKRVILADIYSVVDKDGAKYVFLENNGKAEERKIELGPMIDLHVVVNTGLTSGDIVVVSGQQFLSDGVPIRIAQ